MKRKLSLLLVCALAVSCLTTPALAVEQHFEDVYPRHWSFPYVEKAYEDGIISGVAGDPEQGTGIFDPSDELTCGHFFTIMVKAFYPEEFQAAKDAGYTKNWYSPAIKVAEDHDLFDHSTHAPTSAELPINRFDMATVMYSILVDLGCYIPPEIQMEYLVHSIPDYREMPNRWVARAVKTVITLGLISGVDDSGLFSGHTGMTRAQAAVVYCKMSELLKDN